MREDISRPSVRPAVLVVIGASGAGKTTLVRHLQALRLPGVECFYADDDFPFSADEVPGRFRDGEAFQAWVLREWLTRIARAECGMRVAVLDMQARPTAVRDALALHGFAKGAALLVHCDQAERNSRLCGPRNQRELANAQMDDWAEYLRREAEALAVRSIDTTHSKPDECLAELCVHVAALSAHS